MERTSRVCDFCKRDYGPDGPEVFSDSFFVNDDIGERVEVRFTGPAWESRDAHAGCALTWLVTQLMEQGALHPSWLAEYLTGIPANNIGGDILVTPETLRMIGITGAPQRIKRGRGN